MTAPANWPFSTPRMSCSWPPEKVTLEKAFGFADPDSTSGYLIPNHAFKEKFGGNADNKYNNTFSSVTFSARELAIQHAEDVLLMAAGEGDAGEGVVVFVVGVTAKFFFKRMVRDQTLPTIPG